ncbi:flagellar basal body P-ring protein FlgI [Campylobacter sp. MOP7]|uniref:flagellar basal body P-ring protein FlgI n=1 Tax=Campylobacter canis TaxID=3378588 RepID=UPI00387E535B
MKLASSLIAACILGVFANAAQIKDIANVVGVRENQLIGYGLVVGLNGSGDGSSSEFTIQSLSNMLQSVNVKIDPNDIKSKNTAAVMVTAKLPAFARQGDKLDVVISSIGDAKSLQGGTLLMTPLKGVDGDIYALAQGSLTIGGKSASRNSGNHATAGTVFGGAFVEREIVYDIYNQEAINLSLKESNFGIASNIQNAINLHVGGNVAVAIDPRTVRVSKPENASMVEFLAGILEIDVDYKALDKIIIDERTGTIVSGVNITVDPVVITHKDITIKIEPNSYEDGERAIDIKDNTAIDPVANLIKVSGERTTVASVARALNKLGASPSDIIAIIENLKRVGAIHVDLEII